MYEELYDQKKTTVDECLKLIRSNDVIAMAGDCNEPVAFLQRLHTIASDVENVLVIKGRIGTYDFVYSDGMNGHINTAGFFYGPGWREAHPKGNVSYIPSDLCDFGNSVKESHPASVFVASASPMDSRGNFFVGLSLMWERELITTCDRIILEVNPQQPQVAGGLRINIKDVTAFYEYDVELLKVESKEATKDELKIAQYCRSLIKDGDCIQLGIGALPDAIGREMMDLQDLGIHTEMYTSAIGEMIRKGVATGDRKQIDIGVHVGTFAGGDKDLYRTLEKMPNCRMVPCSYANNPSVIMQNDNMVSVNTCIEIDLTGQICSESIGTKQYSGTGGALDFAYGAMHSKGGRGIMAFLSTTKKGESKINCTLKPGAVVSVPRNYADYIITEYGIARLRGKTVSERVRSLIAIAHPEYRADLRKQAEALFYI